MQTTQPSPASVTPRPTSASSVHCDAEGGYAAFPVCEITIFFGFRRRGSPRFKLGTSSQQCLGSVQPPVEQLFSQSGRPWCPRLQPELYTLGITEEMLTTVIKSKDFLTQDPHVAAIK
jgi:hypothetical protein